MEPKLRDLFYFDVKIVFFPFQSHLRRAGVKLKAGR
jgi:hypothetical protein